MKTEATRLDTRYLDRSYAVAGRVIDPLAGTVSWKGESQYLRRKQLEVLAWLASAGTELVPRAAFIDGIWAGNGLVGEAALTDTISSLRRVLQDVDIHQPLIRTVPRRGYQLSTEAHFNDVPVPSGLAAGRAVTGRPDWLLVRLLAQTAVSETWLARQQGGQTDHVFRFCRDEAYLRLLQREITLLRYLRETLANRQDMAAIIDWQLDEPPYFLQLDYATLGSLAEWSAAQGGLKQIPLPRRLSWMAQASVALSAVHAAGIVHRQLSAAAILLDGSVDDPRVKLGEFGLGELSDRSRLELLKITAAGLTLSGDEPAGPQCYLAPERLAGSAADAASDIYALGVLLFQVTVGDLERPLPRDWQARIQSLPLRDLIARCIQQEAAARPTAAEIARVLREIQPASGPITQVIDTPGSTAMADAAAPARAIGPYRILEPLGDGGMGTVYLAEQRSPVQRTVALKVIKAGMDSVQVLARFEAERQALALMNHVNVASVFDADTTDLGQPYFAMEYVPGLNITAHCDQQELDFRQRIELFLQVCDGVTHAHQKGLIHRDLKPGNILVKKPQGQASTVKIIDFGVAKSLHGKLGAHTAHTRIGSFVGTPVYSSPEQILGHQADVDTRADIYSLGVVLYELLAGVTPYSDQELSDKSQAELVKFLTQSDPPDPASRFRSLGPEDEAEIAKQRSTTVERLIETLGADLSWIVAKCLERDPEDRYGSALELKRDLQRWLDDKPIEARPTTRWYRWRKLIKRNRATVAIAATITLILLGTTTAAIIGYQHTESALEKAEQAGREAQLAADFQTNQMRAIDPQTIGLGVRRGLINVIESRLTERGELAARTGMEQLEGLLDGVDFTSLITAQLEQQYFKPSLQVIASQYTEYPALQAALWQSSADTLFELGLYEPALEPQELAIAQRRKLFGDHAQATLESLASKARLLASMDRTAEAAALLDQTLENMRRYTGLDYPAALDALATRSDILNMEGQYPAAGRGLKEVAERSHQLYGAMHPRALHADVVVAGTMSSSEAVPQLRKALDGLIQAVGPAHRYTVEATEELSWALYGQRRLDEATALARQALQQRQEALGDGHPRVIQSQSRLAGLLGENLQFDEAVSLFRNAIAGAEELFGRHGQKVAIMRGNYGYTLWRQGQLVEAERETRFAADTLKQLYGPDTPGESTYGSNLAAILLSMGRYPEARQFFQARISLLTDIRGNRILLAEAHEGMGQLLLAVGDASAACAQFEAGLEVLSDKRPAFEDIELKLEGALAYGQHRRDGDGAGLARLDAVIEGQRGRNSTDVLDLIISLVHRAEIQNDLRNWDSALASADEALKITEERLPASHYFKAAVLTQRIRALTGLGRSAEATRALEAARAVIRASPGLDPAYGRKLGQA